MACKDAPGPPVPPTSTGIPGGQSPEESPEPSGPWGMHGDLQEGYSSFSHPNGHVRMQVGKRDRVLEALHPASLNTARNTPVGSLTKPTLRRVLQPCRQTLD